MRGSGDGDRPEVDGVIACCFEHADSSGEVERRDTSSLNMACPPSVDGCVVAGRQGVGCEGEVGTVMERGSTRYGGLVDPRE